MDDDSMEQSPAPRPARLSPPLALFPLRKLTEWSKLIWTTVRGVKKAECASVEPATHEARPAPEVVPLRPVSGPSDSRCERRPVPRPLCGCEKQRTDCGMRLSAARLGRYERAIFSPSEVRFRVRQRRELGIERFRREGLCTEESDAATLPLIHCPLYTLQQQALPAVSLRKPEGPLPAVQHSRWNPLSFTGGDAVRISTGRAIKY
nr:unnamed protein product [Leishmania braziliensis]